MWYQPRTDPQYDDCRKVTLTAQAKGLPSASLTLETVPVKVTGGLSTYLPQATLKGRLDRGETPATPSYKDSKKGVRIVSAKAGSNNNDAEKATMISN